VPVSVVIGGQYGSEGKGKVAQFLALERRAAAVVRVGGSNSGHTGFSTTGERHVFRHLPTAALLPDVLCCIGAGSYVDPRILLDEIARAKLPPGRLLIDSKAMVITREDVSTERREGLRGRIGSTGSGTGASLGRRLERRFETPLAGDTAELAPFTGEVSPRLRSLLDRNDRVVVEGTQGFGLSVLHSPFYPYVTTRDTTAAGAISEAGLSPIDVDEIALVLRTHPIRVAGDSGPLADEIDWETVTRDSGSSEPIREFTSVTGLLRRVGRFDGAIVREALRVNRPTLIVLNHLDYVDAVCRDLGSPTRRARDFIVKISDVIEAPIDLVGLGPTLMAAFDNRLARAAS
jgi:adenylosuccinate synthase